MNATNSGEELQIALPDGRPDRVIVRAANNGDQVLHIDWSSAHLRGPGGIEVPLNIRPATALTALYPGGKLEYDLQPVHRYGAANSSVRKVALTSDVVSEAIYDQLLEDYEIVLLVRTCRENYIPCFSGGEPVYGAWQITEASGKVRRVR